MSRRPHVFEELRWRGLLVQYTEGADEVLGADPVAGYCGFDPTAPSLHVGSLVPVMGLVHLQRAAHCPVAVVGGGTGLIGDPSGRANERPLAEEGMVEANALALRGQLERFLDFSGPSAARLRNNADWLRPLSAVALLRDVGKHFSVNYMLAKDSVRSRMDAGISFTEFAYMLLQAYDFLELHRREGVMLQIGGSDQWGNITAGVELVRRTVGAHVAGATLPLVTRSDGSKFGKSEGGNVWLDPALTSPYKFYQFWINTDDRDTGRFLRYFTLLEREAIESLEHTLANRPEAREAQLALALDVTARVHGDDAARVAREASQILFDRKADPRRLSPAALAVLREEIPFARVRAAADATGVRRVDVVSMLVATGLASSKSDGRRLIQQNAVTLNGRRLEREELFVDLTEAIDEKYFLVRKGSRDIALVEVE
jgi:tyrosyl-tRNA synthetase